MLCNNSFCSSSVATFWYGGRGGASPPNVPTGKKNHASVATERLRNIYIYSGIKTLVIMHTYTINAVPLYYFWYGAININIPTKTNIEKNLCMRASGASKLRQFSHFDSSKTAISFNILLVLQILCRYKMTCLSAYTCTDN